jgi:hypothetical protein
MNSDIRYSLFDILRFKDIDRISNFEQGIMNVEGR